MEKYTDTRNEPPKANDFPKYFYAGFYPNVCFLGRSLCIGAITRLTLGIAKNLGWLNFSDSYLSIYGFTALLIYLAYFILLTKFNHGQTIGKMIFGIRVISFDEEELSWSTVLVRRCLPVHSKISFADVRVSSSNL